MASARPALWESCMTTVSMTVNGKAVEGDVEPRTLLVTFCART